MVINLDIFLQNGNFLIEIDEQRIAEGADRPVGRFSFGRRVFVGHADTDIDLAFNRYIAVLEIGAKPYAVQVHHR